MRSSDLAETLPGYRAAPIWFSLFGPANLPRPVVERLYGAIVKGLAASDVREQYAKIYLAPIGSTPEELAAAIKSDSELVAGLVTRLGIKPE